MQLLSVKINALYVARCINFSMERFWCLFHLLVNFTAAMDLYIAVNMMFVSSAFSLWLGTVCCKYAFLSQITILKMDYVNSKIQYHGNLKWY